MLRLKSKCRLFRALVLTSLLLAALSVLRAERLPIKIYTSADGLGTSASFSLVRDARGFIWLCSRDGLVRFDGYRFITYRIGNDEADPAVYSLLPTRNGIYWINLNTGSDYRFIDKGNATLLEPIQQQLSETIPGFPLSMLSRSRTSASLRSKTAPATSGVTRPRAWNSCEKLTGKLFPN
jgi:hypothetical protein